MRKVKFVAVTISAALLCSHVVQAQDRIDFGDDSSIFANDGECDDKRFTGEGMTSTTLLDMDVGRDATDCRTAYDEGKLRLREGANPRISNPESFANQARYGINFGDDRSIFSNDGECDDKRFVGEGMTRTTLLESDIGHDATDCLNAYSSGQLSLREGADQTLGRADPNVDRGRTEIDFGDDASMFANDGECDDKRFVGEGMTTTVLLDMDVRHDATDCQQAYNAGTIKLRD